MPQYIYPCTYQLISGGSGGGSSSGATAIGMPPDGAFGIKSYAGILASDSIAQAVDRLETYVEGITGNSIISGILANTAQVMPNEMLYSTGTRFMSGTPDIIRGILDLSAISNVTFNTVTANKIISTASTGMSFNTIYVAARNTATDYTNGSVVCAGGISAQQPSYFGEISAGSISVRPGGIVNIYNTTDGTYGSGAVVCAGGASYAKSIYVGGSINTPVLNAPQIGCKTILSTTLTTALANTTKLNITSTDESYSTLTGAMLTAGGIGVGKSIVAGGRLSVLSTAPSTSLSTGCALFSGGVAIQDNLNVAKAANSRVANIGNIRIADNSISAPDTMIISAPNEIQLTHNNISPLGIATVGQLQLSAAGITAYQYANTIAHAPLVSTYANGILTAPANGLLTAINGYLPSIGDRIIVNAQAAATQNGIYTVVSCGDADTPWSMSRASDFNSVGNINANAVVSVVAGQSAGITYILLGSAPFLVDTSVLKFTVFITIATPIRVGTAGTTGEFGIRNVARVLSDNYIADAFNRVITVLDALAPASPLQIDAYSAIYPYTLSNTTYSAYNARTYLPAVVVVNTETPAIVDTGVGFGSSIDGTVRAYYTNSVQTADGVIDLTVDSSGGMLANGNLIAYRVSFSVIETAIQLSFNADGNIAFAPSNTLLRSFAFTTFNVILRRSNVVSFYVDDAHKTTPEIGDISVVATTIGRYVSGIRVLGRNDTITLRVTANNCIGLFYNINWVVSISGQSTQPITWLPTRPGAGAVTATIVVNVSTNAYDVNALISAVCQNSANTQSVPVNFKNTLAVRIDSASLDMALPESMRIACGTGLYPTLGNPFIVANSIANTAELQLIGGAYQYPPSVDYSHNYLPSLNYTGLTGFRYAAFLFPAPIVEAISFDLILTTTDPDQWEDEIIQPAADFLLQIQIGSSALYDANAMFNYVTPAYNGDACLDSTKSTKFTKHITFGFNPKTGVLIVRIGLPHGSKKTISGISVTNITQ